MRWNQALRLRTLPRNIRPVRLHSSLCSRSLVSRSSRMSLAQAAETCDDGGHTADALSGSSLPNVKDEPRRELARCVHHYDLYSAFPFGSLSEARSVTDPGVGSR